MTFRCFRADWTNVFESLSLCFKCLCLRYGIFLINTFWLNDFGLIVWFVWFVVIVQLHSRIHQHRFSFHSFSNQRVICSFKMSDVNGTMAEFLKHKDWIMCNFCAERISPTLKFLILGCFHVTCRNCAKKYVVNGNQVMCQYCKKPKVWKPIAPDMDASISKYFDDKYVSLDDVLKFRVMQSKTIDAYFSRMSAKFRDEVNKKRAALIAGQREFAEHQKTVNEPTSPISDCISTETYQYIIKSFTIDQIRRINFPKLFRQPNSCPELYSEEQMLQITAHANGQPQQLRASSNQGHAFGRNVNGDTDARTVFSDPSHYAFAPTPMSHMTNQNARLNPAANRNPYANLPHATPRGASNPSINTGRRLSPYALTQRQSVRPTPSGPARMSPLFQQVQRRNIMQHSVTMQQMPHRSQAYANHGRLTNPMPQAHPSQRGYIRSQAHPRSLPVHPVGELPHPQVSQHPQQRLRATTPDTPMTTSSGRGSQPSIMLTESDMQNSF